MILDWVPRLLRKSKKHEKDGIPSSAADVGHGFFPNATDFTINGSKFVVDRSQSFQTINNTINMGTPVLQGLLPHTCPDAATDALVRSPPPRCLRGTREKILGILNNWLTDCIWMMFWLTGPAGAGKSAIAQTFAEMCAEQGRLGAAYFFIRSSSSYNPQTLIPTLAYQLAVKDPDFQNILGHAIFQDPSIFYKSLRVQLQKLIVEPFTLLLQRKPEIAQKPFFIIIDGLDECQGIKTQCEIVEMIGEVVRLKKDLPLRWLIASRPELHLQYTFSQPDFEIEYHKEVLLIDADTIKDVNLYLRHDFEKIRTKFSIKALWPSEIEMRRLEDIASGLFILATTIVRYVSDVEHSNPVRRLTDFFAFISNPNRATTTKPLQTLDQLYSQILSEISEDVYPITKRILAIHCGGVLDDITGLICCYLLRMDEDVFCDAVKKLHSLFDLSPRATDGTMRAYHASFGDYLLSQPRSGVFHISDYYTTKCVSEAFLFWYKAMLEDPCWISDDPFTPIVKSAMKTPLPGLVSGGVLPSHHIRHLICGHLWRTFNNLDKNFGTELLRELEDFDFRYIFVTTTQEEGTFSRFAEDWSPHTTLVHTKSQDQLEQTLLDKAVNEVGWPMESAVFPMADMDNPESPYRYIFIGHGVRSCLFWFDEKGWMVGRCRLSCKVSVKETYADSDCVIHFAEDVPSYVFHLRD